MANNNEVTVNVRVKMGDRTFTASNREPLLLSGDRRRWARQLREHVGTQVEFLAKRFEPGS